jgi:hypothetical protein
MERAALIHPLVSDGQSCRNRIAGAPGESPSDLGSLESSMSSESKLGSLFTGILIPNPLFLSQLKKLPE